MIGNVLHRRTRCADGISCNALMQVVLVGGKQSASIKARHGLTPPMRDAARRMFEHTPAVDQKTMQKLEDDLLIIAEVCCSGHCSMQKQHKCLLWMPLPDACISSRS